MSIARELFREAARRGLRLRPVDGFLGIYPSDLLEQDPIFKHALLENKSDLLEYLKLRADAIQKARWVLNGEFELDVERDKKASLISALAHDLSLFDDPRCQRAFEKISAVNHP
jgi:hypothetical protein